ncbi:MAG TPA: hypothetical protein VLQ48_09235, partial [Chloroflexia bacterium]|nr:hypothetical protein [Chloroflexia bacterium]
HGDGCGQIIARPARPRVAESAEPVNFTWIVPSGSPVSRHRLEISWLSIVPTVRLRLRIGMSKRSAVGGIPEVVVPGETGVLVDPHLQAGTFDPLNPTQFARELADAINTVALDEQLRTTFGINGRRRVEAHFSWAAIARQTLDLYRELVTGNQ